mmetsp:Transcript_135135/g.431413  ORF Transcript_135135/g.431413 Transcript_135135/m.431413 type:complete len:553 (+) Transcript_135135:32-1690(+)
MLCSESSDSGQDGMSPAPPMMQCRTSLEQVFGSGIRYAAEAEGATLELVSFRGSEALLRGTRLSKVLQGGGRIFATSAGSSATFGLSEVVDRIDVFLSHNWSVHRLKKFIALTCYFSFDVAASITISLASLIGLGTWFGVVPSPAYPKVLAPYPCGVLCRVLGVPLFFLLLFFSRDVLARLGHAGPLVFLDKTCIHQVDLDIQRQGILKLGAFIRKSEQMVVLYSDVYLLKLWTVYEVASFLAIHPIRCMKVVPVSQSIVFCICLVFLYLYSLATLVLEVYVSFSYTVFLTASIAGVFHSVGLRQWSRDRAAIQLRLGNFSVRNCVCFIESDRALVCRNIAALMKARRVVHMDATQDEALDAFEVLVRTDLPSAFVSALGRRSFKYKQYLMLAFAAQGCLSLDYLGYHSNLPCRSLLAFALLQFALVFFQWPMAFLLVEKTSACCLHWHGWRERMWLLVSLIFFVLLPAFLSFLTFLTLREMANESDWALVALCVLDIVGSLAIFVIASDRQRRDNSMSGHGSWTDSMTLAGTTAQLVGHAESAVSEMSEAN